MYGDDGGGAGGVAGDGDAEVMRRNLARAESIHAALRVALARGDDDAARARGAELGELLREMPGVEFEPGE